MLTFSLSLLLRLACDSFLCLAHQGAMLFLQKHLLLLKADELAVLKQPTPAKEEEQFLSWLSMPRKSFVKHLLVVRSFCHRYCYFYMRSGY